MKRLLITLMLFACLGANAHDHLDPDPRRDCDGFLKPEFMKTGIVGAPPVLSSDFLLKELYRKEWRGLFPGHITVQELAAIVDQLWLKKPIWAGPGFSMYEGEFELRGAGTGYIHLLVYDRLKEVIAIYPSLFTDSL